MINLQEQLEKLDKILTEYDLGVGLTHNELPNNQLQEILDLDTSYLENMSSEDCWEKSVTLVQGAIYIQRQINKENARLKWCNATIMRLCSKEWNDYDKFTKGDIKIELISAGNDAIQKIVKIRNHAQVKITNLEHISGMIKFYSEVMIEGARTKRKINESRY